MADDSNVTPTRRQIPRRVRFEVLRRDVYTCRYCGGRAPDVALTVDHVVPVVLGESDDPSNLVTACRDCNAGKASTSPDEHTVAQVSADAERWAAAVERAAEIRRAQSTHNDDEALLQAFYNTWADRIGPELDLAPGDWGPSILRFRRHGLTPEDMGDLIAITARSLANIRRPFRYFCSLAWSEIEQRQRLAELLMEEDD